MNKLDELLLNIARGTMREQERVAIRDHVALMLQSERERCAAVCDRRAAECEWDADPRGVLDSAAAEIRGLE